MGSLNLTELTLLHYRTHRAARLRLDARPLAIFGPNGAGKTNILEAVSMLSPGRGLRRAAAEEMTRRPDGPGWKVTASVESMAHGHELETWSVADSVRQVRIDGKAATQGALGRICRMLWLVPSMDRLWTEGADGRRRFLDRMTLSFEPAHGDASLKYERAMRERNRLLKEQITDPAWYRGLEAQMAEAGAGIIANRAAALARIEAARPPASDPFPTADLAILHPDEHRDAATATDLADRFADLRGRDLAAGRTLAGPHRADLGARYSAKDIPAALASTGEQKALLISIVLANARALADEIGAPPILLFDEVAAHLDENRRAALYDQVTALGAQAFMTGTGPELFAGLGDRAQHFSVTDIGGESLVEPAGGSPV